MILAVKKEVKKFGAGSAHIIVPRSWIGHKILLIPSGKLKSLQKEICEKDS